MEDKKVLQNFIHTRLNCRTQNLRYRLSQISRAAIDINSVSKQTQTSYLPNRCYPEYFKILQLDIFNRDHIMNEP